jgi:hypothetical protein
MLLLFIIENHTPSEIFGDNILPFFAKSFFKNHTQLSTGYLKIFYFHILNIAKFG